MKKLTTPLFAAALALVASGQLASADPESAFGLAPSPAPALGPTPAPAPSPGLPLIPDSLQPADKPGTKPGATPGSTPKDRTTLTEDELKHRVILRLARAKAERDADLQALLDKAIAARTEYESRNWYIAYYTGLVDRMAKYEPSLKKEEIDQLKSHYTGPYFQVRIAPTIDPATFHKDKDKPAH
jgi:hypothetical protein